MLAIGLFSELSYQNPQSGKTVAERGICISRRLLLSLAAPVGGLVEAPTTGEMPARADRETPPERPCHVARNLATPPQAHPGPTLLSLVRAPTADQPSVAQGRVLEHLHRVGGQSTLGSPVPFLSGTIWAPRSSLSAVRSQVRPHMSKKRNFGEEPGPFLALPSACHTLTLRLRGGGFPWCFKDKHSSQEPSSPQLRVWLGAPSRQVRECAGNPSGGGRAQGGLSQSTQIRVW